MMFFMVTSWAMYILGSARDTIYSWMSSDGTELDSFLTDGILHGNIMGHVH